MKNYIVVRLDKIVIGDDHDIFLQGPEAEIQYLGVVGTGNHGQEPIVVQQTIFPMENWYEAEDGGTNAVFLDGHDRAIPLFCFPEADMGDELLISIAVVDNDETSEVAVATHAAAATIATAVVSVMASPAWGTVVAKTSAAVHDAIVSGADLDLLGNHTNRLRKADRFGFPEGQSSQSFDFTVQSLRIRYTVMRVSVMDEQKHWNLSVTLEKVRIREDGDGDVLFFGDDGEIYIRARVATGYDGEGLRQRQVYLPESGTRSVAAGKDFPSKNVPLYFNHGSGLPPFVYVEVGVFEDDNGGLAGGGHSCDDVLGVLPLMFTNRWLREHPGTTHFNYTVSGNDPSSEKAEIAVKVEIWDPHADPDAPPS